MGRLDIRVCEARNLPDTQLIGKPDPYCIVRCENHVFKTRVMEDNLSPKWEEVFKFQIADENSAQLRFELWNSNVMSDELLGMYTLSVSGLKKGLVKDQWHLLQKCKGNAELRVRMCALDFGPDPTPEERVQMQQSGLQQVPYVAPVPAQQQYAAVPQQQPQYSQGYQAQPAYPAQQPQYQQPQFQQPQYQQPQYQQPGYPPQQPGYPPQQPGYPPQQPGYPPQQPGYPPQQQGYGQPSYGQPAYGSQQPNYGY